MMSKSVGFWHGVQLHVESNLADIYAGYPIYSETSACDDPEITGFIDGRAVTRWDRVKTYVQVTVQHVWHDYLAPIVCRIKGCKIEMESIATPDHGSESWHCTRCFRSGHHTYY
jgi:hypothetical protein